MVRVIMHGCNGVMGQVITKWQRIWTVLPLLQVLILKIDKENGYPVYPSLEECKEEADVVVDFCFPKGSRPPYGFLRRKEAGPGALHHRAF